MAAPVFVSSFSQSNASTSALAMTRPAGQTGDVVVLAAGAASYLPTLSAGTWTLIDSTTPGTLNTRLWIALWQDVPATFTVNASTGTRIGASVLNYRGAGLNYVFAKQSAVANAALASITAPSVVASTASILLFLPLWFWGSGGTTPSSGAAPSGMTERFALNGVLSGGAYEQAVATGATGTRTLSIINDLVDETVGYSLLLAPPNTAPNAPTLTAPPNNATIDRAATYRFDWTFSDPDSGDSQSQYDLRYRLGAGAWVTLNGVTPNSYRDVAGGTFAAGAYEWQVRTYDAQGLVGPYSASWFFTAADATGVPTITAPINGSTIALATGTVTWSAAPQSGFQVRKVADLAGAADTNAVYYDSGEVVNPIVRTHALTYPINNRYEHVQVRLKASGLWSAWASIRVLVSWTPPMTPTVVLTPSSGSAEILVAVTNPTPTGGAPVTAYNDIYISSPLDPEYRAATLKAPNSSWLWETPAAGRVYTIKARAIGTNQTQASSA